MHLTLATDLGVRVSQVVISFKGMKGHGEQLRPGTEQSGRQNGNGALRLKVSWRDNGVMWQD